MSFIRIEPPRVRWGRALDKTDSRVHRHRLDVSNAPEWNRPTIRADDPLLTGEVLSRLPIDARGEFKRRYSIIKRHLESYPRLGVLVLAFDESETAVGSAWLEASLDKTRELVIGRHSRCGLPLAQGYEEIPLRHLVLLERAIAHDEVRIRILDLNTGRGFRDERGRSLQSITTESPVFLRVGRVLLMVLVTGSGFPIPDDAGDAFDEIPERVYIEEVSGIVPLPKAVAPRRAPGTVLSQRGPVAVGSPLSSDAEQPVAILEIRTKDSLEQRAVGASALTRGILIGRYDRCDIGVSDAHSALSRVHLMIVRDGEDVIAVDTASTFGSFVRGEAIRLKRLRHRARCNLGGEVEIVWIDV